MFKVEMMSSGGFRGGSGGSLEPPSGSKLFQFHGKIYEKSGKMLETNAPFVNLNPPIRNPGSASDEELSQFLLKKILKITETNKRLEPPYYMDMGHKVGVMMET